MSPQAAEGVASGLGPGGAALHAVLAQARRLLSQAHIPDPGFESRMLLEHFAGISPTDVVARPEQEVPPDVLLRIEAALARREKGEPLHRILGWREFYGLRLALSPETLEPRPDTETLVDAVLPFVRERIAQNGACRILDLGTGTGAIALALLSQVATAEAVGVDVSEDALQTAAANARSLGLESRFRPLRSNWFEKVSGRFALIVSNPPYISGYELEKLPAAVSLFDPVRALDGGTDGLDAYRILAVESADHLESGGRVALEIGHSQRDAVMALFWQHKFALQAEQRDLGGNDRVLAFAPLENAANT